MFGAYEGEFVMRSGRWGGMYTLMLMLILLAFDVER